MLINNRWSRGHFHCRNGHFQVIDLLKKYTDDAPTTDSRPTPHSRLSKIKNSFKKIVTKPFIRVKLQVTTSNIKTNPQRERPSTQTPVTMKCKFLLQNHCYEIYS